MINGEFVLMTKGIYKSAIHDARQMLQHRGASLRMHADDIDSITIVTTPLGTCEKASSLLTGSQKY